MSTLLDRARMMFAAAIAALAGAVPTLRAHNTGWYGVHPAQRSRNRVAMDKRAATKARNVKRNKAHG